jgi:hypothetical protein
MRHLPRVARERCTSDAVGLFVPSLLLAIGARDPTSRPRTGQTQPSCPLERERDRRWGVAGLRCGRAGIRSWLDPCDPRQNRSLPTVRGPFVWDWPVGSPRSAIRTGFSLAPAVVHARGAGLAVMPSGRTRTPRDPPSIALGIVAVAGRDRDRLGYRWEVASILFGVFRARHAALGVLGGSQRDSGCRDLRSARTTAVRYGLCLTWHPPSSARIRRRRPAERAGWPRVP